MAEWVELLKSTGFPVVAAAAIAFFLWKAVWPQIKQQHETIVTILSKNTEQAIGASERIAERFDKALERRDIECRYHTNEFMKELERRDDEFNKLMEKYDNTLRYINGKK